MSKKTIIKYDFLPTQYAGKMLHDVRIIRVAYKEGYKEHPYSLKITFQKRTRVGVIEFYDKIYSSVKYGLSYANQCFLEKYKPLLQKLDCETDTIGLYRVYNAIRDAIGNDTIITVTLTPFLDKGGLIHTNPSNFKVFPSKTFETSINESEPTHNKQPQTDKK
ncbi:hypothetical protein IKQ19_16020 [Candidatus Saccharibacteria bacterium]|jgi:hypothetical protein|nr:hypothetical protein [Candidatus Saccharibacteria bacterium]